MKTKKIVITGGPGTGKSSIIDHLINRGYTCLEEISRQVTRKAKKEGIDQLFLTNPLLFSEHLLKARQDQFIDANAYVNETVFFDRGIPDVLAYMDYIGNTYPPNFVNVCKDTVYNAVFILKPWKTIYKKDQERYENFEQALIIHKHLVNTYMNYNYTLIDVPFDTVENRTNFILKVLGI